MAFDVQTVADVEGYLDKIEGFSEAGKRTLVDGYLRDLAERADYFLEQAPYEHESYLFRYEFSLIDGDCVYSFYFIVDGSTMSYGVVRVMYVEHEVTRFPQP